MIRRILTSLTTQHGIFNTLAVLFLVALLWGICNVPRWDGAQIAAAIIAAVLCALVGNFDRLEFIKASATGLEARTRDVVARAEIAVSELHSLAELTGKLLVSLIAGEGRWGGLERVTKIDQKQQIIQTLRGVGLDEAALNRIETADREYNLYDYAYDVIKHGRKKHNKNSGSHTKINQFVSDHFKKLNEPPSPNTLETFLKSLGDIEEDVLERLQDYRHYLNTGNHRRPESWREVGAP